MDSVRSTVPEWRDLYLRALFESDRTKLAWRIREAEQALVQREHELFAATAATREREAVITALNALHALRMCCRFQSAAAA